VRNKITNNQNGEKLVVKKDPFKSKRCQTIVVLLGYFAIAALTAAPYVCGTEPQKKGDVEMSILSLTESTEDRLGIYKQQPEYYQQAVNLGVRVVNHPERKVFFVYWLPQGFERRTDKRLMVVLHGSNGNAYRHLLSFRETAQKEGFGLVSVQWGWPGEESLGKGSKGSYDYLPTRAIYEVISLAVEYLAHRYGVHKNHCAWLGFSRSSTMCAIFAYYDKARGKNYFKLYMAISGGISPEQYMMKEMMSGSHGRAPVKDCHFYLWGGERDGNRVEKMKRSKEIIESLGGIVDVLRIGSEGHAGFNKNSKYQEEAIHLWTKLLDDEP